MRFGNIGLGRMGGNLACAALELVCDELPERLTAGDLDGGTRSGRTRSGAMRRSRSADPLPCCGNERRPLGCTAWARSRTASRSATSWGTRKLSDVPAQLPQDYDVLLPRAGESESAAAAQVVEPVALVG